MAAQGRNTASYPAHMPRGGATHQTTTAAQSHLINSIRQGATQMAEYYHNTMVPNSTASPTRDIVESKYYPERMDLRQRAPSMEDPLRSSLQAEQETYSHGNGHAPIHVDDRYDGAYDRVNQSGSLEKGAEVRPALAQEPRVSSATRVQLTNTPGGKNQFWRDGVPDDKRTRMPVSPHRRHNTSPDNKYFISSQGNGGDALRQAPLTTDNVHNLLRNEHTQIRRTNSNTTLNEISDRLDYHHGSILNKREYGSTSSVDVQSVSGESFFQMLQDYRADPDQRSPAPPQFNSLLRGKIDSVTLSQDLDRITRSKMAQDKSESKEALIGKDGGGGDNADFGGSPKISRKQSKRSKKNRTKSVSGADQSFFKKKLRNSVKGGDRTEAMERNNKAAVEDVHDANIEEQIEERTRCLAFQHYDVQSTYFDIQEVVRNKKLTGRKKNMTTGASAASRHSASNTPEGSMEDLLNVEQLTDDGDGRGNALIHSCPFFRNEIGDEVEPRVSFSRIGMLNVRAMHREKHRAVLETEAGGAAAGDKSGHTAFKGPVIEFVDHGAMYYRNYFYGFDHQNLFGLDETLGPVAISVRREKLEVEDRVPDKDTTAKYQHRIIVRTSELVTLRGLIAEDAVPSTAKHNSPKGLPLKDILDYVVPNLPLVCLRVALSTPKISEHLLKLDEQGVSSKYKVGIMLCRASQNTEEEMYNNEHSTPAFDEFLECIGERVRLKGFDKYRAQLDNKTDSTGTHSVYSSYQHQEVMFHVSTMLPFTANNRQQLLRKRHIGNDIVTIVFQESDSEPFTPKTIRSQFQHVFVVVRVIDPNTDNVFYSVAVTRSKDVVTFGPPLPVNATFPKGPTFTEFLLAKVINAENAVHKSEKFIAMATRTKCEYLKDLAENSVTATTIETGAKSIKFSLSHKKKEKVCPRPAPDFNCRGALTWRLEVDEFSLSDPIDCICAISPELFTLIKDSTKEVIFSIPCKAIIGWTDTPRNLKVYFNEGNCVRLRIHDEDLDEIPDIVKRLQAVTTGIKTQEITLLRNGLGQLGFHVHYQGIVVEVDPYGWAWQALLRKGARLVEICEIAVCTQTHDEMIDLLRTSQTVKVIVVPPHEDGSPRRGSTPIDYEAALPITGKAPFSRNVSSGKGAHSYRAPVTIGRDGKATQGYHSRSSTMPGTPSSGSGHYSGRTSSDHSSEDPDAASGNVRIAIATLERRINHHPQEPRGGGQQQHRYRATVNYWKEANQGSQINYRNASASSQGSLDSRGSRGGDGTEMAFSRLANDRRSAREMKTGSRLHDTPTRLRRSQEQLEKISSHAAVRQLRGCEDDVMSRLVGDGSLQHSSSHSRQNSMEDQLDSYPRGRVSSDSSKSQWQRPNRLVQSATFPESNQARINPVFSTQNSHSRENSIQPSMRDPLATHSSDDKWYDTHDDDLNGYHDSQLPSSQDDLAEPGYSTAPITHVAIPGDYNDTYNKPERYSPTDPYPEQTYANTTDHLHPQHQQQQRAVRPAPITVTLGVSAPSSSNLSDMSIHSQSTHSSGSSSQPRGDPSSLRTHGGGSLPRNPILASRSPELSRRTMAQMAQGAQGREYVSTGGHQRAVPSASSSSSISETSSPRITRRRTTESRSSTDSLNTRLRQGLSGTKSLPASNEVQENLRKLIAPEPITVVKPATTGQQANLPHEGAHVSRTPGQLHRTYSDESIVGGGGPYNRPQHHRDAYDVDYPNDVLFTNAPLQTSQALDSRPNKEIRRSKDDLNVNNNRGGGSSTTSNPSLFPLPDSAANLDWNNLVMTANAFQDKGLDHQGFKSASSNKLTDMTDPSAHAYHNADKKKLLSQSTDALSPAVVRRAQQQQQQQQQGKDFDNPVYDSVSYKAAQDVKRSASFLEDELRKTQDKLYTERKQKEQLADKVNKLMNDNMRLQGESSLTSDNLQQFTDWFMNAIEK